MKAKLKVKHNKGYTLELSELSEGQIRVLLGALIDREQKGSTPAKYMIPFIVNAYKSQNIFPHPND